MISMRNHLFSFEGLLVVVEPKATVCLSLGLTIKEAVERSGGDKDSNRQRGLWERKMES